MTHAYPLIESALLGLILIAAMVVVVRKLAPNFSSRLLGRKSGAASKGCSSCSGCSGCDRG